MSLKVGDRVRITNLGDDVSKPATEANLTMFPFVGDEGAVVGVAEDDPNCIWVTIEGKPSHFFSEGWPVYASEVEVIEEEAA